MARFYMNLHECGELISDEEGMELGGEADARREAVAAAREVMCAEVAEGRLCLSCCIVVEDEQRREVMRVMFREAVAVTGV